jgi:hypothetical protein
VVVARSVEVEDVVVVVVVVSDGVSSAVAAVVVVVVAEEAVVVGLAVDNDVAIDIVVVVVVDADELRAEHSDNPRRAEYLVLMKVNTRLEVRMRRIAMLEWVQWEDVMVKVGSPGC